MFGVEDTPSFAILWQAVIASVVTLVLAYMAERTKRAAVLAGQKAEAGADRAATSANRAATRVEEVKVDLLDHRDQQQVQLSGIQTTVNTVHVLVNNAMHLALAQTRDLALRLATLTGSKEDWEAAQQAEEALARHDTKQAEADTASAKK